MSANVSSQKLGRSKNDSVRWSVYQAATEFGISLTTLQRRLSQAGEKPGEDERYSSMQIKRGLFPDDHVQKVRKLSAEADLAEMDAAEKRGELVNVEEFAKRWDHVFVKLKQLIRSSTLPESSQVQLLGELEKVLKDG